MEHGRVNSDHRPIWVEITKDSFLGQNPLPLSSYQARRLRVQDPRTVAKYNFLLEHEFENTVFMSDLSTSTTTTKLH